MARSSTSGPRPDRSAAVHRLHTLMMHHFDVSVDISIRSLPGRPRPPGRGPPLAGPPAQTRVPPGESGPVPPGGEAVPWPDGVPTRNGRRPADVPHRGTGRVPPRPQLGHPRVPQGTAVGLDCATPTPNCSGRPPTSGVRRGRSAPSARSPGSSRSRSCSAPGCPPAAGAWPPRPSSRGTGGGRTRSSATSSRSARLPVEPPPSGCTRPVPGWTPWPASRCAAAPRADAVPRQRPLSGRPPPQYAEGVVIRTPRARPADAAGSPRALDGR